MTALNWPAIVMFLVFVVMTLAITWFSQPPYPHGGRFLCCRWRHQWFSEWLGHRRRLYVGGVISGDFRIGLSVWF